MKSTLLSAISALTFAATTAHAGGLDRSGTPIDILFEQGNTVQLSFGIISPEVSGRDLLGNPSGDVADTFSLYGLGVKYDLNEKLSFAVIFDQPYGANVQYAGAPATTLLGGTTAKASSQAVTVLGRYKFSDRISVYGGPRAVKARGNITLSGLAYGGLNGYNVNFSSDTGFGYVVGAAYEITKIALRASLTYHSEIDLSMDTTENFFGGFTGQTQSTLPQSVKLAVQSGISQNTLVFGSVRWSDWEKLSLNPPSGPTPNLAEMDEAWTYELGIGRKFNDRFSGSLAIIYDAPGSDSLVSPLAPTNGSTAVSIGGKYKINDNVDLSVGVRYTWLGNANPETGTPDVSRGSFTNNTVISGGFKVGVHF